MNAIVFQCRTSCDALYDSRLEPWSSYLTGKQGQAPDPYYDPLKFWIDECHKRGLELHAWFNPFRARVGASKEGLAESHIANTHPDLVKTYGHYLWLDPGAQAAQEHTFKVFMDVVERYDVDGIHIDDYFYPYPEKVNDQDENDPATIPFDDAATYAAYQQSGGKLSLADWRRDNINRMMKRIYEGTKSRKKWVQYGISPFGIARPGKPSYVKGFDQYDKLYADAEKWLKAGWCDYMVPQLYWAIGAPQQPFLGLLQWWTENNPKKRHIYAGMFTSRIDNSEKAWCPGEILGQIEIARLVPGAAGHVHFSMMALTQNRKGVADQLRSGLYANDALAPATPWLGSSTPASPSQVEFERVSPQRVQQAMPLDYVTTQPAEQTSDDTSGSGRRHRKPLMPLSTQPTKSVEKLQKLGGVRVMWKPASDKDVFVWAVYAKQGDEWTMNVVPASEHETIFRDSSAEKSPTTVLAVSGVDRLGNEGPRKILVIPMGDEK